MKLIKLDITSDFKNINGIKVKFSENVSSHVLIGNNGSGKTSILEALSSIFKSLYTTNPTTFEFGFLLQYMFDNHTIMIIYSKGSGRKVFKVDGNPVSENIIKDGYLPSRIICNYSGEDMRIKTLYYKELWENYIEKLKNTAGANTLKMWFVDKEMWKIILLVMLAFKDRNEQFKKFIEDTIGIRSIDSIKIDFNETNLKSWKENTVKYYINQVLARMHGGVLSIDDLNPLDNEAIDVFSNLAGAIPLINNLEIKYNGGIDSTSLSEGEKKMMVVLFIEEVLADQNSLILLDEPDSHIHVAKKEELQQLIALSENRENLLTSHSPTLTAKFDSQSIVMLERDSAGLAKVISKDKQKIITDLTKGLWTLQEQNIFLASNKDVVVVEGKTDEVFLEKSLKYLQSQGRFIGSDFSYLPCGGASNVKVLLNHFTPKTGQLMVSFFDSDNAGWDAINDIFGKSKGTYNSSNFGKAQKLNKIWFAPYPKPKNKTGVFNIEDYFPHSVFLRYVLRFKSLDEIMTKDKIKTDMANDCQNGVISGNKFVKFEAVFDLIEDIREADAAGVSHI